MIKNQSLIKNSWIVNIVFFTKTQCISGVFSVILENCFHNRRKQKHRSQNNPNAFDIGKNAVYFENFRTQYNINECSCDTGDEKYDNQNLF